MKELYEINEEAYPFKNGNAYAYDMLGNRIAITDALGNTVFRSYDPFGNITVEWGATYPVRYTYDTQNRRTSLTTTRDGTTWDVTRWMYDASTGLCTSKTYADGAQILYTHTPDGFAFRTTYASGRWTESVYNERREVIGTLSNDNDENVSYVKDEFGRVTSEMNNVASVQYSFADTGLATNEVWTVSGFMATVTRSLDGQGHILFNNGMHFTYADDGNILCLSNELARVEYSYSPDRLDIGYTVTLSNGRTFSRNTVRDTYRRGLLMNIASAMNGSQLEGLSYGYDALNRMIARNSDIFGYNERSEVTGATVSGSAAEYAYDEIGNSATYTANNLNQYSQFQYDQDGNLLSDGIYSFTYDSSSRLKTVVSNGVLLVTNYYDAKSRRVRKETPEATTVFIYDDWNLIEERVAYVTGAASTIKYYWGKDLSGELQGAGGVGGLLYFTVDDAIYIPCYDNNGNVTKYVDENGNIVASYTYDAFGVLIAKSGPLADVFRHRFSTKYFDIETGLYYYGYRFYNPDHMRWLNRDPIEENGGLNLYGFCGNNAMCRCDYDGRAYFIKRRMDWLPWLPFVSESAQRDIDNRELAHEQLIFQDDDSPSDVGYSREGIIENDDAWKNRKWVRVPGIYNDCVMRKAVSQVSPLPYSLLGDSKKGMPQYNCQNYADALRAKYSELIFDKKIRCECGLDKDRK